MNIFFLWVNEMTKDFQTPWIISMLKKYFQATGLSQVGNRRLHYWIGSLPESERMLPGKYGLRPYRLNRDDYQNIACDKVADARIAGLIPWDCIVDDKNEQIHLAPPSQIGKKILWFPGINLPSITNIESMDTFYSNVTTPKFSHQDYHLLICIEKATAITTLKELAEKHGADLLVFRGQPSVTRINDAIKNARIKGKPIALFYISDLDIAGWNMPKACIRNINDIYPKENILVKILLSREQVIEYHLPAAFETKDKSYSKKQKDEFILQTGSNVCVELDALPENIIFELLDEALSQYSGLDKDRAQYNELQNMDITIKSNRFERIP